MSTNLLFNMLSRLVIAFLPRSKHLLISWLQSPSAVILEPREIVSLFPLFPHLFTMKWLDQMPWSSFSECWVLSQLFHSSLYTDIYLYLLCVFSFHVCICVTGEISVSLVFNIYPWGVGQTGFSPKPFLSTISWSFSLV